MASLARISGWTKPIWTYCRLSEDTLGTARYSAAGRFPTWKRSGVSAILRVLPLPLASLNALTASILLLHSLQLVGGQSLRRRQCRKRMLMNSSEPIHLWKYLDDAGSLLTNSSISSSVKRWFPPSIGLLPMPSRGAPQTGALRLPMKSEGPR
ncbi:MAG: hypothetical protein LBG06_09415 [Deltaproteobacteria bacterium]|jgi:hypothetical protein|nr:hypothetical protein [Deltaproteobacteria bacterium]